MFKFHGESITTDANNIFHKTKTLIPTLCRNTKSELTYKTEVLIWMTCIQWWNVKLGSHSIIIIMMTSSNGNIFPATVHLSRESTSHRLTPLTKASDVKLWCFLWSVPEQMAEQTIKMLVNSDGIALVMTSLQRCHCVSSYQITNNCSTFYSCKQSNHQSSAWRAFLGQNLRVTLSPPTPKEHKNE